MYEHRSVYKKKGEDFMDNKRCINCKYFRLHYIKYARGNYSALSYGHCVKPRLKKRYTDDKACIVKQLDYSNKSRIF